ILHRRPPTWHVARLKNHETSFHRRKGATACETAPHFACGTSLVLLPGFLYAARRFPICGPSGRVFYPTRSREREWSNPNTLRSHISTQMTTTAFKIDLMEPAIGMNRLISHRMTPTTIKVNKT